MKLALTCLSVLVLSNMQGCGSGCKPTQATAVASSFMDPCFSAKAGSAGDTCGLSPSVLVSNACSANWVNTGGILVAAGGVDVPLRSDKAILSGSRYQITGTIGSKSAVVSFEITETK